MSDPGGGPDASLRRAEALVYVEDVAAPELTPEDEHHLARVLRLRDGEAVVASDGRGGFRHCALVADGGAGRSRRVRLEPTGAPERFDLPAEYLTVGFALAKGERSEWIIQKLTEIGIDRIVPLLSERTIVRLDDADGRRRAERFERIAREAGAQSRRVVLPLIEAPVGFEAFVSAESEAGGLVLAEPGGGLLAPSARTVLVGPEGGWSAAELARCPTQIGLGRTVLRSETAAIVAATLLVQVAGRLVP